ncbi:MAG TPA: YDG domain-containing protein [Rhodocyclaceae bacterium]|nr:YDG domain-containing protein [Rhodocyclaceae bacterium]
MTPAIASDVVEPPAVGVSSRDAPLFHRGSETRIVIPLHPGWNLLGNSSAGAFAVDSLFGDANKAVTVWKWNASRQRWAFYSPFLTNEQLSSYAASLGYDVLETIDGGDGFWVNAADSWSVDLPAGATIRTEELRAKLLPGWNLVGLGELKTPRELHAALNPAGLTSVATPPAVGQAATYLQSLWTWDNARANWYFHAPSLDSSGELADYLTRKAYLDFTANNKTLGPGVGVWLNRPAKIPLTIAATGVDKVYDATTSAKVVLSDDRRVGDVLQIEADAKFDSKNVGARTISVAIRVGGRDADKYFYNTATSATAVIKPKALNISGISASNKVYDGIVSNTLSGHIVSFPGDAVTTTSGTGSRAIQLIPVGTDAVYNYALPNGASTVAINPISLTTSGVGALNKTYDGGLGRTSSVGGRYEISGSRIVTATTFACTIETCGTDTTYSIADTKVIPKP